MLTEPEAISDQSLTLLPSGCLAIAGGRRASASHVTGERSARLASKRFRRPCARGDSSGASATARPERSRPYRMSSTSAWRSKSFFRPPRSRGEMISPMRSERGLCGLCSVC